MHTTTGSKVSDLNLLPSSVEQYVLRLNVSVEDSVRMHVIQGQEELVAVPLD